jgi:hypothetical protein
VVQAGGPYSGNEGAAIPLAGSASDPDGDPLTVAWSINAGAPCSFANPGLVTTALTCADNGTYVATLTANDGKTTPVSSNATVTVANVPPTVGSITAPVSPVQVGTSVSANAPFTDPGTLDTHTAVWDWGDGTTSPGTVTETNGSGSVAGAHTYTAAGVYTLKLTVTDKDGGSAQSVFQYVVVYDPNGGFVTGGGWINSPAGAYAANPALTGGGQLRLCVEVPAGCYCPDRPDRVPVPGGEPQLP